MHRFVWDLRWNRAASPEDEESELEPSAPKVPPGRYQIRLTVDRETRTQPLEIVMDPRSPATPEVLAQQFELGKQIFIDGMNARRALGEIASIQKQIEDRIGKPAPQNAEYPSSLSQARAELEGIVAGGKGSGEPAMGLRDAYRNSVAALRVVEGGDRPAPAQARALYEESRREMESRLRDWAAFEQTGLPKLNQQLERANLSAIEIGGGQQGSDPQGAH